jgi:hypothetical protein
MFQMVTGESCQCIRHTEQTDPYHVGVQHSVCTLPKCGFVIRYQTQNTSNLEQHYIRGGLDHKELAGRLTAMQQMERGVHLGAAPNCSMALFHVWNTPAYDNTLLMQGAQYPTCNLVMPKLYQMSLAGLICE